MMETDELSYTEKDVSFWKTRSERSLSSWRATNGQTKTSVEAIAQAVTDPPETSKAPF